MIEFMGFGDSTSSRIENKLTTIDLSTREIEKKRIAIVQFRKNERSGNGNGSGLYKRKPYENWVQLSDDPVSI